MSLTGLLVAKPVSIYRMERPDMMDYVNVTPLVDPIVNWANVAPFEPRRQAREADVTQTRLAQWKNESFDLFASRTGALAPTTGPKGGEAILSERASVVSEFAEKTSHYTSKGALEAEIDRIANQRVKLMAANYASSASSVEIVARLEILNRRLLDRAPRVSKEQVEALESANEKLVRIRTTREQRSKRLGVSA